MDCDRHTQCWTLSLVFSSLRLISDEKDSEKKNLKR